MGVAEMKIKAMDYLLHLESEKTLENILSYLENLSKAEKTAREEKISSIFEEASAQYGNTLKKLAE
ncbi:MAG TPA: hypothetical protein PKA77_13230 [Chitinophagaceae bacterium]|jgi:hypothetical protein|nr:hypothetical protein [Chitinophagaceae bacterium]HMU57167.1 hypothetical protein [Chitinophagaceae bacterium]